MISVAGVDVLGCRNFFEFHGSVSERGIDGWPYGLCDGKRWKRELGEESNSCLYNVPAKN